MSEPRTAAGMFLRNGLEAMGFDEASANEAILAIEAEAIELWETDTPPPMEPTDD